VYLWQLAIALDLLGPTSVTSLCYSPRGVGTGLYNLPIALLVYLNGTKRIVSPGDIPGL